MTTFNDMEDNLRKFIVEEQSDAHNIKTANFNKYNNLKVSMDPKKYTEPHFIVRISISEAVYKIADGTKINGGVGFEEKFITKWYGRMGIKNKLTELWQNLDNMN